MTPLGQSLVSRIMMSGPLTVAEFMSEALMHPAFGYYATRDPFGITGDFITAPEISQMFGELLGLCLAQAWLDQGSPRGIVLAELGPGRGTLMADVLRATGRVPGFHSALSVHLVEASPVLRTIQATRVPGATWHGDVTALPEGPLWLVANEFLDALPIRQFVRSGPAWKERTVGLIDGRLAFGLAPSLPVDALSHRLVDTQDGDLVEVCPALGPIVGEVGRRVATHGGMALFVDYGDWRSVGDTLQAIKGHTFTDPLGAPGEADLTAHVDFEAVARAAPPARATAMVTQRDLLLSLGIEARAAVLGRKLTGEQLKSHWAALDRLTDPAQMGHLFKAMGLYPPGAPPPPGFAA